MPKPMTKDRCDEMVRLLESYEGLPCPNNAALDRALDNPNGAAKKIIQMLLRKKRLKRIVEDGGRRRLLVVESGKATAPTKKGNTRNTGVLGKCKTPVWIAGKDTGDYGGTDCPDAAAGCGVFQATQPTRMIDLQKVNSPHDCRKYAENN